MRRGRYTTDDNWTVIEELSPHRRTDLDPLPVITTEACDVTECNGVKWLDGGRRVRLTRGRIEGFRAKTFIGETAWSDAQRYASDWCAKAERA